jgi:aryl-alcohol dehydrogenase-like predicted oxidoreductase
VLCCEARLTRNQSNPDSQELLIRFLRAIGNHHGRSPGEVAVVWVLRNPAVTGAIMGARRPGQMKGIVGAAGFWLSPSEVAEINAFFAKPAGSGKFKQLV